VSLPYPVMEKHGEDVRDFLLRDGKSYQDLLDLAIQQQKPSVEGALTPATTTLPPPPTSKLPSIIVNKRQLRAVTADAMAAILACNTPPRLFQRGSLIRLKPGRQGGKPGLEPLGPYALRQFLTEAADWFLQKSGYPKIRLEAHAPTMDVVHDLASLPEWPLPEINGVIDCPVFDMGGRLVDRPGYDADSKLYNHQDPRLTIPSIPPLPSDDEIGRAVQLLLKDLLGDFSYIDEASKANTLAAMLTPFVRAMIDGPTPLGLISAPAEGTGKGLLASCICTPATGSDPNITPEFRDESEAQKKITALLLDAPTFIFLDNLRNTLDSPSLAAALTAPTWKDRLLGASKMVAELAVVRSRREVAPLAQVQVALPADAAFIAWVDVADKVGGMQEHWGCVVRPQGLPHWERLPGSGPGGQWTREDTELPGQLHTALVRPAPEAAIDALAQKLHAQRLAPLDKHLKGVQRLFVAPVNRMAGIPVEALTNQYTVSYTPSGTYLARLKDRQLPQGRGLLAVGDPVFPPAKTPTLPTALPTGGLLITQVLPGGVAAQARLQTGDVLVAYAGQDLTSVEQLGKLIAAKATDKAVVATVWREGQEKLAERELAPGRLGVALAKEPAREAITARRQANQLLANLQRGDSYAELPGTQVEIARLAELFDPKTVTTLTRAVATEQRLDELRRAGTLGQFRYLHLATHGQANNVRAFESALLLTPPAKRPEVRVGEPYLEGRLTAAEVLEFWKLDADLVTLSACESGLGRKGGGDGLLGFAQAFLMAGSRSVCLTLWQVDDTATALLMDRFYRNLLGKRSDGAKPMPKAAALREAKDWLRAVTASEALERLGALTRGVVRGERPAREEMQAVPKPKDAGQDYRPYAHPRFWAAFILIGDPE